MKNRIIQRLEWLINNLAAGNWLLKEVRIQSFFFIYKIKTKAASY